MFVWLNKKPGFLLTLRVVFQMSSALCTHIHMQSQADRVIRMNHFVATLSTTMRACEPSCSSNAKRMLLSEFLNRVDNIRI